MRPVFLSIFACLCYFSRGQDSPIVPQPVKTTWLQGSFTLDSKTILFVGSGSEKTSADFFNDYLQRVYGFRLTIRKQPAARSIRLLTRQTPVKGQESRYHLKVAASGIVISGEGAEGTFYGMQTLIQLLPTVPSKSLRIPAVSIEDYPRFAYRGLHLDVGRHFFPVSFVKRYIDYIALHKMNYFHWHLTDDQGWRIAIKKYPRLTTIGACRDSTLIGHYPGMGFDSTRYCGFYTREEVKEVIKYAAARYVTILPEIELPGHSSAALAAYPWLGCTGGPYQVQPAWGVIKDVFCAGNDSAFAFIQDVLDEVMALFPSTYIHIGGDECPKDSWKVCPKCQKRMHDLGLKDEHALQSYFIQRIERYINSRGKQIIGWDELLEGGLAPKATVMSWRGEQGGIDAARLHHNVIMTPDEYVYFDYSQAKKDDSLTIGGYLPLEKVYHYEPIPSTLDSAAAGYIRGAQANVWTEYIANTQKIEYMIFPRLSAISEVLWSPKTSKNWTDFQRRMKTQYKRYDLWKANYYHGEE